MNTVWLCCVWISCVWIIVQLQRIIEILQNQIPSESMFRCDVCHNALTYLEVENGGGCCFKCHPLEDINK